MSTYSNQFPADLNTLTADATKYQEAEAQEEQAKINYDNAYQALVNEKNPEILFVMLIMLFSQQGFSEMDNGLATDGSSLKIQGDITKCGNDLENTTNQTDTTTGDSGLLATEAGNLDSMIDTVKNNTNVQNALGSTATDSLEQQFLAIRGDIKWEDDPHDPSYNPTGTDYHFDVNDSSKIQSYGELQDDMKAQGDTKFANEAYKLKTDAFNMNTSTTQSTSAASNEMITNASNIIKSLQSFTVDMMHAMQDTSKAAIQHMSQ